MFDFFCKETQIFCGSNIGKALSTVKERVHQILWIQKKQCFAENIYPEYAYNLVKQWTALSAPISYAKSLNQISLSLICNN